MKRHALAAIGVGVAMLIASGVLVVKGLSPTLAQTDPPRFRLIGDVPLDNGLVFTYYCVDGYAGITVWSEDGDMPDCVRISRSRNTPCDALNLQNEADLAGEQSRGRRDVSKMPDELVQLFKDTVAGEVAPCDGICIPKIGDPTDCDGNKMPTFVMDQETIERLNRQYEIEAYATATARAQQRDKH